jgi:septal ring factor EnvC (AmiA/AmiB activator)
MEELIHAGVAEVLPQAGSTGVIVALALWIFKDIKSRESSCAAELKAAQQHLSEQRDQLLLLKSQILNLQSEIERLKHNLQ